MNSSFYNNPDSAVQEWLDAFVTDPQQALDRLLMGKVWLGGYAVAEVPTALRQILPTSLQDKLDVAMHSWLQYQLQLKSSNVNAKLYAQALNDAFALLQDFDLPQTHAWCTEQAFFLWDWLPTRNIRLVFLRALALRQPDRKLLPFWLMLRQHGFEEEVEMAVFGLHNMPSKLCSSS